MKVPWKKLNFNAEYVKWIKEGRKTATTRLTTDLKPGDIGWDAINKVAVVVRSVYHNQPYTAARSWYKAEGFKSGVDFADAITDIYGDGSEKRNDFVQIFFLHLPGLDLSDDDTDGWFPVGSEGADALSHKPVIAQTESGDYKFIGKHVCGYVSYVAVRPLPPPYVPPQPKLPEWDVERARVEIAVLIAESIDTNKQLDAGYGWKSYTDTRDNWVHYCKLRNWPAGKKVLT